MTLEHLREVVGRVSFNKLVGIRVVRQHRDGVTLECALRDELLNIAGVMHGGVAATIADTAVGMAIASHFGGRRPCTTTDLKVNYLRPIPHGKITARSRLVRVGKTLCVGRVDMLDAHRKLAAVAIVTYMLL